MDIQGVPKIGISSVVHSKHIDPNSIDVVDNDIALFDTESVTSLYNGLSKLEVVSIGLCLEGSTRFNISLREFELIPGRMVIALPNQIIEHRQFSANFRGIFFAVSKNLLESLPKVGNVLSFFFFLKDYPCFDLNLHEQEMIKEYHAFIRKRLRNKEAIRKVGLDPDDTRTFKKYSLGMKQRLGIAAAIMEKPDIVILDEPINALDEAGAGLIKGILDELKANGSLIIIACHDTEELNYLSDEIYEIYEGQIVSKNGEKIEEAV